MLLNNVRVTFECCLVKLFKNYVNDVYFNLSLRGYLNAYINDAKFQQIPHLWTQGPRWLNELDRWI
jgi:hypothetical protein